MSRTDGHAPYWTWATWYEPVHDSMCEHYIPAGRYLTPGNEPCDLPKRPERHASGRTRYPRPLTKRPCTWEPVWPRKYSEIKRLFGKAIAPHWFIRHVWHGPERVRERNLLGRMAKEYNATGELDDGDFPNYQARHCARWLWD